MKKKIAPTKNTVQGIPWYKTLQARVGAFVIFLAAVAGLLNDSTSYMDRFNKPNEVETIAEKIAIDDLLLNIKPVKLQCSKQIDIINSKAFHYTLEAFTAGTAIVIGDSIKITKINIDNTYFHTTEEYNRPSIELVSSEIESVFIGQPNNSSKISLLLRINAYPNSTMVWVDDNDILNVGDIVISIPYRTNNIVKKKEQKISVLVEKLPRY